MMSIDQGKPVLVVLLDLSAVFDRVDHNVLFSRSKTCSVCQVQRSQKMSVFGIWCATEFSSWSSGFHNGIIAQRYDVKYHLCTCDTQLYIYITGS